MRSLTSSTSSIDETNRRRPRSSPTLLGSTLSQKQRQRRILCSRREDAPRCAWMEGKGGVFWSSFFFRSNEVCSFLPLPQSLPKRKRNFCFFARPSFQAFQHSQSYPLKAARDGRRSGPTGDGGDAGARRRGEGGEEEKMKRRREERIAIALSLAAIIESTSSSRGMKTFAAVSASNYHPCTCIRSRSHRPNEEKKHSTRLESENRTRKMFFFSFFDFFSSTFSTFSTSSFETFYSHSRRSSTRRASTSPRATSARTSSSRSTSAAARASTCPGPAARRGTRTRSASTLSTSGGLR